MSVGGREGLKPVYFRSFYLHKTACITIPIHGSLIKQTSLFNLHGRGYLQGCYPLISSSCTCTYFPPHETNVTQSTVNTNQRQKKKIESLGKWKKGRQQNMRQEN